MDGKLHILWDMDGTLVDSAPEVYATIEKSLASVGVDVLNAVKPLRIGPPVRMVIRNSFPEELLSEEQLDGAVKAFRQIYDTSDFVNTNPFDGIDDIMHDTRFIHHIITNKPDLPTNRIVEFKGWKDCVAEVLTPNTLDGRNMSKPELFTYCRSKYPDASMIGVGDMASDCEAARAADIDAIGVLWGTGTQEELENAECKYIVSDTYELKQLLEHIDEYNTI